MSHAASARYRIAPAPGGLALVQDLLNTRGIGAYGGDLLATAEQAKQWLRDSVLPAVLGDDGDGPHLDSNQFTELSERDLAVLVTLRSQVQGLIRGDFAAAPGPVLATALSVGPAGELRLEPRGRGMQRVAAAVWVQVFLAQQSGQWARLKVCRSEPCSSAFYDHSRNNSGVWHDVRTCGNRENLRASRARRRAVES
jgi:hypothetical protein